MNKYLISHLTMQLAQHLRRNKLPVHITEIDINGMFGTIFHSHFNEINMLLKDTAGIWGEAVLCPALKDRPRTGYYTFYWEGQKSLFLDVRAPEAGPYFIPDELRS